MARRVQVGLVTAALLLGEGALAQQPPPPLVSYSFDDDQLDAGPDTFAVFQHGQGSVKLTSLNRYSGYRAVELRDVPGDHSFPELQGYFPLQTKGKLYLHFAFLTTDPAEELNIALAGPQWFKLRKHGIGFWLKTAGGNLTAISDSMPKKLMAVQPFTWYIVDVTYDIDAGTYDLAIHQEGLPEPVAAARAQPNAANQPGSQVDKFSFIGDHDTDLSGVVYYVDDVLIGADEAIARQPFAAPGRRKLFFDYWSETRRLGLEHPAPLPMTSLVDVGIGPAETAAIRDEQGAAALLGDILTDRTAAIPESLSSRTGAILSSLIAWRAGHAALAAGDARAALTHFDRAAQLAPSAALFKMDAVMALAHLAQWEEVDKRLPTAAAGWRGDPRLPVALAMIGLARLDLSVVEAAGVETTDAALAEQYFLALLWKDQVARAETFAAAMIARGADPGVWRERLGDAAFVSGDIARARTLYEESLATPAARTSTWLKLSDVYFKLGDLGKERSYRERIYGSLTSAGR